ncbi:HpcH/HpaI aldolase family protein [Fontivita pretiosa]|uniref:HpcH/HpaI aldolase family protein n=1 Tax=Fontivita pretiosa TaxID=2989684 RepID=UPI003D172C2A
MSPFRAALATGTPQLGLSVMYPAPGIIERIGPDWDWIWIDAQHGELGYHDVLGLVRACDLVKRAAMVRVPGHEAGPIGLALDMAPAGVIVPCVDTPEQARAVVDAAKFPPLGKRSYGGRRPIDLLGRKYSDTANEDLLLIVQIESPQAIENAEAIAAVPGIDALFLGPDDIMLRRGYSMTAPRSKETLGKDMQAVISACRKHGKVGVMVGVGEEMLRLCVSMGFQMIVSGSDVMFLATGSKRASEDARAVVKQQAEKAAGSPQQSRPVATEAAPSIGSPY